MSGREENKIIYPGSLSVSRLKVAGEKIFSMGDISDDRRSFRKKLYVYSDSKSQSYRKIVKFYYIFIVVTD